MSVNLTYLVIISLLVMVFVATRRIKSNEKEYFVLNKTEKTVSKGCAGKTEILIELDTTATKCID